VNQHPNPQPRYGGVLSGLFPPMVLRVKFTGRFLQIVATGSRPLLLKPVGATLHPFNVAHG
jgi:hypothetical protein